MRTRIGRYLASARRLMRRADRGQAVAEVAIALPILLALLIGIFEFARAYNVQQVITNAAREGARVGVLPSKSDSDVLTTVNTYLSSANVTADSIDVQGVASATGNPVVVTVAVDYDFLFIGPVLRLLAPGAADPGTITLSSRSTMRKE